jgi:hypothetical protein
MRRAPASRSRGKLTVNAVFEKFTERSIKSVMIAQQEAKNMGAGEVLAICQLRPGNSHACLLTQL